MSLIVRVIRNLILEPSRLTKLLVKVRINTCVCISVPGTFTRARILTRVANGGIDVAGDTGLSGTLLSARLHRLAFFL